MHHVLRATELHGLKCDERLACEIHSREGEGHVYRAAGFLCGEGGGRRDLVALVIERGLAGGLVHEGSAHGVLIAGDEAGVFDGVHDSELIARLALVRPAL